MSHNKSVIVAYDKMLPDYKVTALISARKMPVDGTLEE